MEQIHYERDNRGRVIWNKELLDTLTTLAREHGRLEAMDIFSSMVDIDRAAIKNKLHDLGFRYEVEDLLGEVWKTYEPSPNYSVSNMGRVKVHYKAGEKLMSGHTKSTGYKRISIVFPDHKKRNVSVHRMVAQMFIPNPENKPEVDHINGDKTDNRVENLRWSTSEENQNNPVRLKRIIQNSKNTKTVIIEVDELGNPIRIFNYMSELYHSSGLTYISNNEGHVDINGRHFEISHNNGVKVDIAKLLHSGHSKEELIKMIQNYNEDEYKNEVYESSRLIIDSLKSNNN